MEVLLVDDEPYILEYLAHIIHWEKFGFTKVWRTSNPREAKEWLKTGTIDLMISDIRIPEISGMDLLVFVEEHQLKTTVYFLSGYSDFNYAQEAIRFGVADYLLKPITKENLEKAVGRFYENHQKNTTRPLEKSPKELKNPPEEMDNIISFLQDYIKEHLSEDLSLSHLAQQVYLNASYLSNFYKKKTGDNLSNFIVRKRMEKAAQLLVESQLKISDIAQMVGYKKPQYFDQLFKKEFQMLPQQYRRKNLGH